MARNREWIIGGAIVLLCLVLIMVLATRSVTKNRYEDVEISSGGEKLAIIKLTGPIYSSDRIVRQFKQFGKNKSIKGIIFRIDSPGGGVAPSQEIYEAVKRVRNSGKPVVVSMASVAASGGYYVACGADTIMANPGTTTGSIGVIAQFVTMHELFKKIGIEYETVKSGRFKDTGSMHREMNQADRTYLQGWIDDAYDQFVGVVAEERGLTRAAVVKLADGRVYTGRQAYKSGLVDCLGDFEDAVELTAQLAGIDGTPALIQMRRSDVSLLDLLLQQAEMMVRGANGQVLMYRYH